jgi:hypothetical protein
MKYFQNYIILKKIEINICQPINAQPILTVSEPFAVSVIIFFNYDILLKDIVQPKKGGSTGISFEPL